MAQQTLFETFADADRVKPEVPVERQLTRRSHDRTSREAAQKLVESGNLSAHAIVALAIVRKFPNSTAAEIDEYAQRLYGLKGRQASKRLGGLSEKCVEGVKVVKSGNRRACRVLGSSCKTWWVE